MDISTQRQVCLRAGFIPWRANIPPPSKGFALDPLEDVLDTKGRSWEKAPEFGPPLCPRRLGKMKDNNRQLRLPELKPMCQKCPTKTAIHLQNLPLPAAYKSWNNSGEKGFSYSTLPDQHSVSRSLSNHLLPAKGTLKNFIFASRFSASPFPSSAAPCQVLLRSWATYCSFQFQNLNSIHGCGENENGRISLMIQCVGSAPVPALKCSEFTDRLAPSFTTIPYSS